MKKLFLTLMALTQSCAMTRAPSLQLLEKRADFDGSHQVEEALTAVDNPLLVPIRTEPLVADIWIHPHELPSGDYFRGAWVRTIVKNPSWRVDQRRGELLIKDEEITRKKRRKHGR